MTGAYMSKQFEEFAKLEKSHFPLTWNSATKFKLALNEEKDYKINHKSILFKYRGYTLTHYKSEKEQLRIKKKFDSSESFKDKYEAELEADATFKDKLKAALKATYKTQGEKFVTFYDACIAAIEAYSASVTKYRSISNPSRSDIKKYYNSEKLYLENIIKSCDKYLKKTEKYNNKLKYGNEKFYFGRAATINTIKGYAEYDIVCVKNTIPSTIRDIKDYANDSAASAKNKLNEKLKSAKNKLNEKLESAKNYANNKIKSAKNYAMDPIETIKNIANKNSKK